jgi:hypothetical protein
VFFLTTTSLSSQKLSKANCCIKDNKNTKNIHPKFDNKSVWRYTNGIVNNKELEMSKLTEYTLEIYKADKRVKKADRYGKSKPGLRFYEVMDFAPVTKDYIEIVAEQKRKLGFVVEVFETYVTRKNLIGGKEFQERYDTPYYCSPSSETYWSA